MMDEPLPVSISLLQHFGYCPRQAALIDVDGEWVDSGATARGRIGHERADTRSARMERGRKVLRAIPLWSYHWNLVGRADAIEIYGDRLMPVEYKIGDPHVHAAAVQLCAQAFCLEEMTGRSIADGAIWYSGPRRRFRVVFDDELRERTADAIESVHRLRSADLLPDPADDRRCSGCQFLDRCLPSVCKRGEALTSYVESVVLSCSS